MGMFVMYCCLEKEVYSTTKNNLNYEIENDALRFENNILKQKLEKQKAEILADVAAWMDKCVTQKKKLKMKFAVSLRKLFDCVLGTKAKEMLIDLIAELEKEKI